MKQNVLPLNIEQKHIFKDNSIIDIYVALHVYIVLSSLKVCFRMDAFWVFSAASWTLSTTPNQKKLGRYVKTQI